MLVLSLFSCSWFDTEKLGIYGCDEYCPQVIDKTNECAEEQYAEQCAAMDSGCPEYSEEELAEYASEGNEDWKGKSKDEMLAECKTDLEENPKDETECQAATGTINNLSCDEILNLIGDM